MNARTRRIVLMIIAIALALWLLYAPGTDSFTLPQGETTTKIVGGEDVMNPEKKYPFYVKLKDCGGALISPRVVVTASHCNARVGDLVVVGPESGIAKVSDRDPSKWSLENIEPYGEVRKVVKVITHPKANIANIRTDRQHKYDVTCLVLDKASKKKPIGLPTSGKALSNGTSVTVIGFGLSSPDGDLAETRKQVENGTDSGGIVPYFMKTYVAGFYSKKKCMAIAGKATDLTIENDPAAACVIDVDNKESTCNGDSGGPVFRTVNGKKTLYGVVSRNDLFCNLPSKKNATVVVTHIPSVLNWLKMIIKNNE